MTVETLLRDLAEEFRYRSERWAQEEDKSIILERSAMLQSPSDFAAGCRKAYAEAAAEIAALLQRETT